jgi:hypothetical protein
VGFERKLKMSAFAIALLLDASGAAAASPEPLIVTELPDPNLIPLGAAKHSDEQSLDAAALRFSLAIAQALQSEQRSMEQACHTGVPAAASRAARFDWQANCLYRRH